MEKIIYIGAPVIVVLGLGVYFFTNLNEKVINNDGIESSAVARQFQDEQNRTLTVWNYDNYVIVDGAEIGNKTMQKVSESDPLVFSDGEFELSLFDLGVNINRTGEAYYQGSEFYTADSWKTIIPRTCKKYFDGCNICSSDGGCTEASCSVYQQPRCLDSDPVTVSDDLDQSVSSIYDGDISGELGGAGDPGTGFLSFLDTSWRWVGIVYADGRPSVDARVVGSIVTFFSSDGVIRIASDCSIMNANFTRVDNALIVNDEVQVTNLLACPEAQDQMFLEELKKAESFTIDNGGLRIITTDRDIILFR